MFMPEISDYGAIFGRKGGGGVKKREKNRDWRKKKKAICSVKTLKPNL